MSTNAHHVGKIYERVDVHGSAKAHIGDEHHTGPKIYIQNYSNHLPTPAVELVRNEDILPERFGTDIVRYGSRELGRESVASILKRVSAYDAPAEHWRRSCLRVPGTCQWIFKDQTFLKWQRSREVVTLWCTGPVGCGKSILASSLIDHVTETKTSNSTLVLHCYIESTLSVIRKTQDILLALAKQCLVALTLHSQTLPLDLESAFREAASNAMSMASLQKIHRLFEALLNEIPRSIFVVDGVDSLPEDQILDFLSFIRGISELLMLQGSKLAIISRRDLGKGIDIRVQLARSCFISLDYQKLKGDVSKFIDVQMETLQSRRVLTINEALLKHIRCTLKASGQEMFLWIYLQLLNIWDPGLSTCDDDIERLLESLPVDLTATYKWCLRRISSKGNRFADTAVRAFRWVSQAKQPLNSRQLREAVSLGCDKAVLTQSAVINSCVTEYCANLLIIDPTGHVRFTHPSVQQFLENSEYMVDSLSRYFLSPVLDNTLCGRTSVSYLVTVQKQKQLTVLGKSQVPADFNQKLMAGMHGVPRFIQNLATKKSHPAVDARPFTLSAPLKLSQLAVLQMHRYFVAFWLDHTTDMRTDSEGYADFEALCLSRDAELWPGMPSALDKSEYYKHLIRVAIYLNHIPLLRCICEHLESSDARMYKALLRDSILDHGTRALHLAAALGHLSCVAHLAQSAEVEIDAYDDEGKTALCWAAENGHMDTVWLLSQRSPVSVKRCQQLRTIGGSIFTRPWGEMTPLTDLSLPAILAQRASPDCCHEFVSNNTRNDLSLVNDRRIWSQTFFAACLNGHSGLARRLVRDCAVNRELFQPFPFPGFKETIKGSTTKFAIVQGLSQMLCTLLEVGASIDPSSISMMKCPALWDMYILTCCLDEKVSVPSYDATRFMEEPELISMMTCGLTDRIYEVLRTTINDENFAKHRLKNGRLGPSCVLLIKASLWPNFGPSFRKWRDLARIVLPPMEELHTLNYFGLPEFMFLRDKYSQNLELPDDILIRLILSDVSYSPQWEKTVGFQHRKSSRAYIAHWAISPDETISSAPTEIPCTPSCQHAECEHRMHSWLLELVRKNCLFPSDLWMEVIDVFSYLFREISAAEVERFRSHLVAKHKQALLHRSAKPNSLPVSMGPWLVFTMYQVALACVRSHCERKRWRSTPIFEKFLSLYEAGSDGIFDLNFPYGYIELAKDEWVIKPFIVSALYRWNWRLRRRKRLPYSEADRHYCPIICARTEVQESGELYK